jgi:hypothetical protein
MENPMKSLKFALLGGVLLFAAPAFAANDAAKPSNPCANVSAKAEGQANVTTASAGKPEGPGNVTTASAGKPEGPNNVVTASAGKPEGPNNVVTAASSADCK